MTDNTRGALLMIASMLAFTVYDQCIKATDGALAFFQLLFFRGVLSTFLIAVALWWLGHWRLPVPRADRKLIALRSLSEIAATMFFLTALFNMPLANVIALLQLLPLTVTLVGAVVLGEAVGWRRMGAILIGFCGMLLIVRPGSSGFNVYTLYALVAVVCVTFRDLFDPPHVSTGAFFGDYLRLFCGADRAGGGCFACGRLGLAGRQSDSFDHLSALFIFADYCTSVVVMQVGDLRAVTPFRYTSLLWALLLGWLVFGEWPAPLTFLGVIIIAATGCYTLYREAKMPCR